VLRGNASINCKSLSAGDAAAISDESQLLMTTDDSAELMLFDMA
jgi:redox-sensitive bicupin YhaK (pirin superfamily)